MFNFDIKNLSNDDLIKLYFELDNYIRKLEKDLSNYKNAVMKK